MRTLRFKTLLLAVAVALLAGTGIARAGDDTSHRYCSRGASMYWGIFGYWCEDGTYAGVQPFECKSGPGRATGAWNNSGRLPTSFACSKAAMRPSQCPRSHSNKVCGAASTARSEQSKPRVRPGPEQNPIRLNQTDRTLL